MTYTREPRQSTAVQWLVIWFYLVFLSLPPSYRFSGQLMIRGEAPIHPLLARLPVLFLASSTPWRRSITRLVAEGRAGSERTSGWTWCRRWRSCRQTGGNGGRRSTVSTGRSTSPVSCLDQISPKERDTERFTDWSESPGDTNFDRWRREADGQQQPLRSRQVHPLLQVLQLRKGNRVKTSFPQRDFTWRLLTRLSRKMERRWKFDRLIGESGRRDQQIAGGEEQTVSSTSFVLGRCVHFYEFSGLARPIASDYRFLGDNWLDDSSPDSSPREITRIPLAGGWGRGGRRGGGRRRGGDEQRGQLPWARQEPLLLLDVLGQIMKVNLHTAIEVLNLGTGQETGVWAKPAHIRVLGHVPIHPGSSSGVVWIVIILSLCSSHILTFLTIVGVGDLMLAQESGRKTDQMEEEWQVARLGLEPVPSRCRMTDNPAQCHDRRDVAERRHRTNALCVYSGSNLF